MLGCALRHFIDFRIIAEDITPYLYHSRSIQTDRRRRLFLVRPIGDSFDPSGDLIWVAAGMVAGGARHRDE